MQPGLCCISLKPKEREKKVNPMRKKARIRKIRVPNWLTYDFPLAVKAKVNRLWGGEWQGQQKWFLMRLTKDESEVNLATGEAKPEFAEWKWARLEEVIEQAVDYKRPTYEEVMRAFNPYVSHRDF
ncbi:hypothetical protein UlMin_000116 [Ulmus minor]